MRARIALLSCILLVVVFSATAAERHCLADFFTNTSCTPCEPADPFVDDLAETHGEDLAVLEVHVWWPSASDPFYLAALDACNDRTHYYQDFGAYVDGVPSLVIDGMETSYYTDGPTVIASRLTTTSPLSIEIGFTGDYDSVIVVVDIEEVVTGGDKRLFVAITENELYFDSPIGIDYFQNVLRGIYPDADGEPIDLTSLGTETFHIPIDWDFTWDVSNCKVVAWVQDVTLAPGGYSVHNAAWEEWPDPDYYFTFYPGLQQTFVMADSMVVMGDNILINTGATDDVIMVKLDKDLPPGWSAGFCAGTFCYSDSGAVDLAVGDTVEIDVEFFTVGDGIGSCNMTLASTNSSERMTYDYMVIQNPEILYIDDDEGGSYESYYETSLDGLGEFIFTLDRSSGEVSASDLTGFDIVIWSTGGDYGTVVTASDTTAIGQFLDGGGKLFMTSQDLGWYCNDGLTVPWTGFYKSRFKADYIEDDAGIYEIIGTPGGTFEGISGGLFTGDAADIYPYPSSIDAFGGGSIAINYDGTGSPGAAVTYDGTYRLVYFAFPLEAVNGQANRDSLMAKALRFLRTGAGIENNIDRPIAAELTSVVPNPFNAACDIEFNISRPNDLSLIIFDLSGREVSTLADGNFASGSYKYRWDGRDNSGRRLPSGIYMARLKTDKIETTKRLMLVK